MKEGDKNKDGKIKLSFKSIYGSIALVDLCRFVSFLIHTQSVCSLDGGSATRKAATYKHRINTQISMPRMGFEPTIPMYERAKTVHALDRTATVIGLSFKWIIEISST
jgi:hypothetical protein